MGTTGFDYGLTVEELDLRGTRTDEAAGAERLYCSGPPFRVPAVEVLDEAGLEGARQCIPCRVPAVEALDEAGLEGARQCIPCRVPEAEELDRRYAAAAPFCRGSVLQL